MQPGYVVIFAVAIMTLTAELALPLPSSAGVLTEQEARGKQLYLKTTSPSGNEIRAVVGKGSIEAPGSTLTCVSCHDFEGQGLNKHGIDAPDITWEELARPLPLKKAKGSVRPPYTEATLRRAIIEGVDPDGRRLDEAMPRYSMSTEDLNDLVAYLKVISQALDPGVTDALIKVGTMLPAHGTFAEMGRAMRAVMEAYFKEISDSGGLYNRKIELGYVDSGDTPEAIVAGIKKLIHEEEVFAIVSPFTLGADKEAAELVETLQVPMIGPFTLFPEDIYALNRYTFYLLSGLRELARAQVVYFKEVLQSQDPRLAVAYPTGEVPEDIPEAIETQGTAYNWRSIERIPYSPETFVPSQIAQDLHRRAIEAVLFLGRWEQLQRFLHEASSLNWFPYIFITGVQVKQEIFDIPSRFTERVFIAYPTLSSDYTADGMRELESLRKKFSLSTSHIGAQVSAYCAAKVLVEGIKAAGGKLSREKLVNSLDRFSKFETHLSPPISYDPNRRIGALGAHIVTIDLEKRAFVPLHKWIKLE